MAKPITPWSLAKAGCSEHAEQSAFFAFLNMAEKYGLHAALEPASYGSIEIASKLSEKSLYIDDAAKCTFAVPNGGSRGDTEKSRAIEGGKMRAEGVKSGVPDVLCLWPMPKDAERFPEPYNVPFWHGAAFEFKRASGSLLDVSDNQKDWLNRLAKNGYWVRVVFGWKDAVACYLRYLQFDEKFVNMVAQELDNVKGY